MSYLEELKERYKAARRRMEQAAIRVRPASNLPPPTPKPEPEAPVKKPGLISEKAESDIISKALKIVNSEEACRHTQAYRMADELVNSPRLPPIPGLVLNETGAIRWMRIMHAVAKQHGIDAKDIMSESRKRHIINARFEVFYRLRIDLGMSYMKIAGLFGKDHSTIIHGVNKLRMKLLDEKKRQHKDGDPATGNHLNGGRIHTDNLSAA